MIFQTIDDVKNKFERLFPQGVDVRHHFEQDRITPPYPYNDQVLPPYEFPTCGINTIDVSGGEWSTGSSVYCCAGTILGFLTASRPTTLTCDSAVSSSYTYLRAQGFALASIVGPWITAGSFVGAGLNWRIGTTGGVDYIFIPDGLTFSADVIPSSVYSSSGIFVFSKWYLPGFVGDRFGIAINKWDGSFRYGTLASTQYGNIPGVHGLFAYAPLSPILKNGVCFSGANRDAISGVLYNEPLPSLYSCIVPDREELFEVGEMRNAYAQFDGYLITPKNSSSNFSPSYTLNTI